MNQGIKRLFTFKNVVEVVVTAGVGKVIDDVIDKAAPEEMKLPAKIIRKIGSWSIGWFIGQWASNQAQETYDLVEERVKQLSDEIKKACEKIESEESDENQPEVVEAELVEA